VAGSTGGGFGFLLIKAAQSWRTEAGIALRPHELTVPQFLVLMALYRQARHNWECLTQVEVATTQGMDANTISQIVRALERRGLITRDRHAGDGRAIALALTDAGLERSRDASADVRAVNDVFFSGVSPDRRAELSDILTTLISKSEQRS
jgi:MarR family transcriptional regulator, organic hydroperoxide resistance regulator